MRDTPASIVSSVKGVISASTRSTMAACSAGGGKGTFKFFRTVCVDQDEKTPAQRHVAMSWAQRLKRVFNIDVETCRVCGAAARVIACIEDPVVIRKILNHLQEKSSLDLGVRIHNPRAPPQASLFS